MRTVSDQTEIARRARFDYEPDRHYVLVQKPDLNWDGPQFDRLMDEVDPSGGDAYRVEADGENGADARRITGHRQMVMLSCSKAHIEDKIRSAANVSNTNAVVVKLSPDFEEKLEFRAAISIDDIPNRGA